MPDGSLVSSATRNRLRGGAEPFAALLGRLGLTPNVLTVAGFLVACLAAVAAGLELWLAAGLVSVFGAAFDMLDGALARATGRVSRFGGFLDSTLDRWGEGVVYVGVAYGCLVAGQPLAALLAMLTLNSAFMVSYTRAKAESLGWKGETGIAPRPERVVLLGAGLVGAGLGGGLAGGPWLQAALAVLLVTTTVTVIQRVAYVRHQAAEE